MQTFARLDAPCRPEVLFRHISHLDRYPAWMSLVHRAELEPPGPGDPPAGGDGDGPAWLVELRARVGPLARSKRLRMVRTECVGGRSVTFERRELDGRAHSSWVLHADVEPVASGSRLTMHLSYGGSLWTGGVLQRILEDEIRAGSERLVALVTAERTR